MGMFANLTTDNLEESQDSLGGNFDAVPSDAYDAVIKLAYVGKAAQSNAQSITIHAELAGREYRETIWITNKNGENFYPDKQDASKRQPLPGFTTVDNICMFATEQPLANQETEEKVVKIYNFQERKEVPTPVQVLTGLIGKSVKLAILRQIVDKQKKNEASGKYENTGETRTENVIDAVFHPETGRTINEYKHGVEAPEFLNAWKNRNSGKDRNRAKGAANGGGAGQSGEGRPGGQSATKSLFG